MISGYCTAQEGDEKAYQHHESYRVSIWITTISIAWLPVFHLEKERVHTVQDSIRPPKASADWVNLHLIVLQHMFWITVEKQSWVSNGDSERLSFHQSLSFGTTIDHYRSRQLLSRTVGHYRRPSATIADRRSLSQTVGHYPKVRQNDENTHILTRKYTETFESAQNNFMEISHVPKISKSVILVTRSFDEIFEIRFRGFQEKRAG